MENDEDRDTARLYNEKDNEFSYSDFIELVTHSDVSGILSLDKVTAVLYGFGKSEEGYGQWDGAFILRLNDGQLAIVHGGCDTTGWGCQDSSSVDFCPPEELDSTLHKLGLPGVDVWDEDLNVYFDDLQKYLREGKKHEWDD